MSDTLELTILTERIRAKMEDLKVNQAQLAKVAGITPGALSQILAMERTPSSGVLVKLATALGVSVDYLVGKAEETDLSDLLQNEDAQLLFRDLSNLSHSDKDQIRGMIEFLKQRNK
jgi:transcriptional regulator with XRE-family HTH domain